MQNSLLKESKLKVSFLNLDKTTESSLNYFFNSNLCTSVRINLSSQKSELIIVDNDRISSDESLNSLIFAYQFIIVLYSNQKNPLLKSSRVFWIKKPISSFAIKNTIESILNVQKTPKKTLNQPVVELNTNLNQNCSDKKLANNNSHLFDAINSESEQDKLNRYKAHKYVGGNSDINPNNSEELDKVYLTPEKYLYHYLVKAKNKSQKHNEDIEINTLFGDFFFNNKNQKFYHKIDKNKFKHMQSAPIFEESKLKSVAFIDKIVMAKSISQDANAMIWECAILASKGRVPKGTSLQNEIHMQIWPNFSKLLIFRFSIQICAAWSKNKLSILESAKQLKIPQRYVLTLYCAMQAINCAYVDEIKSSTIIKEAKSQSVFSKLLSHIFIKK